MSYERAETLWTTPNRTRHFLIPEDAGLPTGDLHLRTSTGRRIEVDEIAVAQFEVSEEEAKAWLKEQLGEVLGEAKAKLTDFVGKLREKTAEMRAENKADWAEGDGENPPGPGRQAVERLGGFLQDFGEAIRKGAEDRKAEKEARAGDSEASDNQEP